MKSIFSGIIVTIIFFALNCRAVEVIRLTYDGDPQSKESALVALSYLKTKQKIPEFLIVIKQLVKPCSFNPTVTALHLCFEKGAMKTLYSNRELINGTISLFKEE